MCVDDTVGMLDESDRKQTVRDFAALGSRYLENLVSVRNRMERIRPEMYYIC
jgi:hypothetical protein